MQEFSDNNSAEFINWFKQQWEIDFNLVRQDMDIQGSPERTISRVVIEDSSKCLYLVEKFPIAKFELRNRVARAVDILCKNGLGQALAYRPTVKEEFLPKYKDGCIQVSLFLDSTGIKRPDYLMSSVIGEAFAGFLVRLVSASKGIDQKIVFSPFSIKDYIYELFDQMKIHDPEVYNKYSRFLFFLEKEFMQVHDRLPVSFCHGDLHPLNVIWDKDKIRAVIDWEFTGIKPDIYDAANLVGCAGIEDPNALGMPMVMTFLKSIRQNGLFSRMGWRFFPEYVLALRFAWLSEWLRKDDQEMIAMEEAYMDILMNHMEDIRSAWGI